MPDWEHLRTLFPSLEKNTYLNTAGGGPLSRYAADEAKAYYEEELEYGDTLWNTWLGRTEEVRGTLAAMINAEPEEIAFLANSSTAMNLVAQFFRSEGHVITMADDFPSVTLPWLLNKYAVDFARPESNGWSAVESVDHMRTPDSRYLVTSFVQYVNGFRCDLAELGDYCRSSRLHFIVDATQGFGVFPIDVKAQAIDILIFSAYKWTNAGYGIAPLFIRKGLLDSRVLPACGWRSAKVPYDLINDRLDLSNNTSALELGHPAFPGIFALRGALRLISEIGIDNIAMRVARLTDYLRDRLTESGVEILSQAPEICRSGITLVAVERPEEMAELLGRMNIFVSARGQGLRVSIHYYNNRSDIDLFIEKLKA